MIFSVHIPTAAEGLAHPVPFVTPRDFVRIARAAEAWGYHGVWGNYHVTTQGYVSELWSDPPAYYDTLVVLSAIAAETERLHLGTAVLPPQLFTVPVLAKQVATLDQLSGGRVRLGVGVGAYREELEAVWPGKNVHRGHWLDESIEALRLLFTERSASYDGQYVVFSDLASHPKPVQSPLPIYVGGHHEATIERAAQFGDGWIPGWQPPEEMERRISLIADLCIAAERDPASVEVAPQLSVVLGESDATAVDAHQRSGLVAHRRSLSYTGRDLDRQIESNLIGSPETVAARVAWFDSIGVDHLCALWFPTDTVDEMLDQMQWFAEQIIRPVSEAMR